MTVPLLKNPVFFVWFACSLILIGWEIYLHKTETGQSNHHDLIHQQQGYIVKKVIHHVGKHGGVVDNLNMRDIRTRAPIESQKGIKRLLLPSHPVPEAPADYPHHQYVPIYGYRQRYIG